MKRAELDRLIHARFAGNISDEEAALLAKELVRDPAAARRLLELSFVEAELPAALRAASATSLGPNVDRGASSRRLHELPRLRPRRLLQLALAASLLLAAGLVAWMTLPYPAGGVLVAVQGEVSLDGREAQPGDHLNAKAHLRLAAGARAEVLLADGSILQLSDDSELRLGEHAGEVRLERGRCLADIALQRGGRFAISTPAGEISVLGTRFSVAAGADATEVVVERGRVAVAEGGRSVELAPGQWTLAAAGRELRARGEGESDLDRGLLGFWPCDEGDREEIRDHSPWIRHGHIVAHSRGAWSNGFDGHAALALGQCGRRPDGVALPELAPGQLAGLTLALRLKWEGGATPALLGEGPARFRIDEQGHALVEHRGATLSAGTALRADSWHHLAWRWSRSGRWDIFVDGQAVAGRQDGIWSESLWPTWPLALGAPRDPRIGDFACTLNQVRLYGRALSEAEIGMLARR